MVTDSEKLGVTVLAGFLGAGKTTLVNHLLHNADGRRLGVMVNDFGALNIDEAMVDERRDDLIALSNGCVCCSLQGELSSAVESLLNRKGGQLDHLLIECSGVSDPERVINVLHYPRLRARARLDGVITLMDSSLSISTLSPSLRHLVACQIESADLVVVNKIDLVSEEVLIDLEEQLLLPDSRSFRTAHAELPTELVFLPTIHEGREQRRVRESTLAPTNIEALGLKTISWSHEGTVRADLLRKLLDDLPTKVLRFKGIVCLEDGSILKLQRAAGRLSSQPLMHRKYCDNRLVFIFEDMPEIDDWLNEQLALLAQGDDERVGLLEI